MTLRFCLVTFLPIALVLGVCAGGAVRNWVALRLGGVWRQHAFRCALCNKRRHIARPGPIATVLCIHCPAAPKTRGNYR